MTGRDDLSARGFLVRDLWAGLWTPSRTVVDPEIPYLAVETGGTTFQATIAATAVVVSVLSTAVVFTAAIAATAVGLATVTAVAIFAQTVQAAAVGVASRVAEFISGAGAGGWRRNTFGGTRIMRFIQGWFRGGG